MLDYSLTATETHTWVVEEAPTVNVTPRRLYFNSLVAALAEANAYVWHEYANHLHDYTRYAEVYTLSNANFDSVSYSRYVSCVGENLTDRAFDRIFCN